MNKEEIHNSNTLILAHRLNEIMILIENKEMNILELEKEYNIIVQELWNRIPSLKNNKNIKIRSRIK